MPTGYSVPAALPVDIAGHQFQVDYEKLQRHLLSQQRSSVDSSQQQGASSLNPEAGALRSATDWSLGAGQEFFDDLEGDPRRYYLGSLVQAVRRGRIQLANQPVELSNARGNGQFPLVPWTERWMLQTGNSLFWFEFASPNFTLYQASMASGPYVSPTVNTKIAATATSMLCLATDGTNTTWLARGGSGVSRATTETGAWTAAWSAVGTNVLVYANGHLLGIAGAAVWEFDNAGAKLGGADIFSHPNTSWAWQGGVAGTGLIYLWGSAGTDAAIYVISDILQGGTLAPPKIALPLPPGEYVVHMEPVGGFFVARTNLGIRILTPNGDVLESGPLIVHRDDAAAYANTPSCVSGGVGDSVMVSWRRIGGAPDVVSRLDLSRFAGEVPAHHLNEYQGVDGTTGNNLIGAIKVFNRTDVTFSSGALYIFGGNGSSNRRIWGVQINQAPNSSNTSRAKQPTGSVYTGWITYETTDFKTPMEILVLLGEALPTGATVEIYWVDDVGNESLLTTMSSPALGTSIDMSNTSFKVRRFQIKVVLKRSTDTLLSPSLDSWQVRNRLIPNRQEEILLPLRLTSRVLGENSQEIDQDPYAEFVFLKGLVTTGLPVLLKEGSVSQRVIIDDIQLPDGASAMSMRNNAFYEGTYLVRCLGAY